MNNAIYWNPDPEIINILGFSLRYYGVLFVSGLIICIIILNKIFARENIEPVKLDKLTVYGVVGILAGARLGHCLFYEPAYYLSHPLEILLPIQSTDEGRYVFTGYQGLASHGGALGMLIAILVYVRKTSEPLLKTLDMIAIAGPLSGVFIRLANLANSEIIGTPSDLPWAFVFARVDDIPRHPAQLYEAIAYLIAFGILFYLYKSRRILVGRGFYFGLSILMVFVSRFVIEFVKKTQVSFEDDMTLDMGQWLSAPYILMGIIFIVYATRSGRKKNLSSEQMQD
jgi:prolipoprotein diacylglyceryl transferase